MKYILYRTGREGDRVGLGD